MKISIFIGWDPRPAEVQAYSVARHSIRRRLSIPIPIKPLILDQLREQGLYTRPTEIRDGRLWDVISNAPMSTQFAISRFLTPHLAGSGQALFVDADVMARANVYKLFLDVDPSKAVSVVKHVHRPTTQIKMDGQVQTSYERKNWSSVVVWNVDHPKNKLLTPEVVNSARGLWLHQFGWLDENDIGELDPGWNHLAGESPPNPNPSIVHFTNGTATMPGYENCEFADEWLRELWAWAA